MIIEPRRRWLPAVIVTLAYLGRQSAATVRQQRIDRFFVAMDDVQYAGWQPCCLQQLRQAYRARRHLLGRLHHKGVPARNGQWKHPHGHHGGKGERADAHTHAEGFTYRMTIDTTAYVTAELALQEVWNATGELDHFQAAL